MSGEGVFAGAGGGGGSGGGDEAVAGLARRPTPAKKEKRLDGLVEVAVFGRAVSSEERGAGWYESRVWARRGRGGSLGAWRRWSWSS